MTKIVQVVGCGREELVAHCSFFGTTGLGQSRLLANQAGVTLLDMKGVTGPSEEQVKMREIEAANSKQASEKRLQMVRDAYWAGSDADEFDTLHDSIVRVLDITPTPAQLRAVFNLLPQIIIGGAVEWGMDDTAVRDDTYVFIEENENEVRQAIEQAVEGENLSPASE